MFIGSIDLPRTGDEARWSRIPVSSRAEIECAAGRTDALIKASPHSRIEHDIRWARSQVNDPHKRLDIYVHEIGGVIHGYAPVFVHPGRIGYRLGELTLLSLPVRRSVIAGAPLALPGINGCSSSGDLSEDFLVWLRHSLHRNDVVFLDGLLESCPLYRAVADPHSRLRRSYFVVRNGPLSMHRAIEFDGGYEDYLRSLGAKTRADLKRTRRRLAAAVNGEFRVRCFTRPEEVAEFTTDAMKVSRMTWQFNWMGGGLRDREALLAHFAETAKLGWFRSYILYVSGQPIAFQVGLIYNGTFHAREIGYDPDWRKLQAGIFLHTEIVSDLLSVPGEVTRWDFGHTDTLHKQRLSNRAELCGFFYLIPRTWRGAALSRSMIWMNGVSSGLGRVLDKLSVRQELRRLLRKLGAAR